VYLSSHAITIYFSIIRYQLPRVNRRARPSVVAINQGYRYLGEREEPVCAFVLFMVQFGVKCWEVSLETALEHFNYTFPEI
jgi:hypothetical protein